jgi:hypothetical protein
MACWQDRWSVTVRVLYLIFVLYRFKSVAWRLTCGL